MLRSFCALFAALFLSVQVHAADRFIAIKASDLKLTSGTLPVAGEPDSSGTWRTWNRWRSIVRRVAMEGSGEAYLEIAAGGYEGWSATAGAPHQDDFLVARLPEGSTANGKMIFVSSDGEWLQAVAFALPADAPSLPDAERRFHRARALHYQSQASRNIPGAAWFRLQAELSSVAAGDAPSTATARAGANPDLDVFLQENNRGGDLDATYQLFSGGEALAENLQLDRRLNVIGEGDPTVDIEGILGVTTNRFDFKPLLPATPAPLDPLAAAIPDDQHAVFFPSFAALMAMMDEADAGGTPIVTMLEARSQDRLAKSRYQRQLCLPTDQLSRLLGPALVKSIALTGSDPYLRQGSDVAVLFDTPNAVALTAALTARQAASGAPGSRGETAGVAWQAVRNPDRTVCSYLATVGERVIVTNSPAQLERLIAVAQGKAPALAASDDYRFFRARYALGDASESALVILADATIRRWTGPQWRIAESRRIRAWSALTRLQMQRLNALAGGEAGTDSIKEVGATAGLGDLTWTDSGPVSSIYGSPAFMTPVIEMKTDKATPAEAEAYGRFRDAYQRNWGQFFDPIAIRMGASAERISADMTVIPLILASDYRHFIEVTSSAKFTEQDGDRHADALAHFIMSIDPQSPTMVQAGGLLSMQGGLQPNPLSWMGNWLTLYADADPVWDEAANRAGGNFNEDIFFRLPLVFQAEVRDALKLTVFLASIRTFADQSAPGLSRWATFEHNGKPYVRVAASDAPTSGPGIGIWYAATPKRLIVSLREDALHRAMDRQNSTTGTAAAEPDAGWLGKQVGLQIKSAAIAKLREIARDPLRDQLREAAWSNIPILNEWHTRLKADDPAAFHEKATGTRLVAPRGGGYVWNAEWATMESVEFGHPGAPKGEGMLPAALATIEKLDLGLEFEHGGLRARGEARRSPMPR